MHIRIEPNGTSPLLMHNPRMIDPECAINRELGAITSKRKKTEEDRKDIERLEWYGGLYDDDGVIVQPTSKVRKCLINTARITKLGKAVERAVSFATLHVPLAYDGPPAIDAVFADARFTSRLPVGVRGSRVMRVRPKFFPWSLTLDGWFVDDIGLAQDDLKRIVELAGISEGIGDNRVNGYGRFEGKVVFR